MRVHASGAFVSEDLWRRIAERKAALDARRPLAPELIARLEAWYEVELTYSSNAIEGNTLTRSETAIVLEKGLTVRGKPLRDHMEATDHRDALRFVRGLAARDTTLREVDLRSIHSLVLGKTGGEAAGRYSQQPRFVAGSRAVFPEPSALPALMAEFTAWLAAAPPSPQIALEAHLRLVSIHPFADGNGRTARLLMNLILMRSGYPPLIVPPEIRPDYIDGLERAQTDGERAAYDQLMATLLLESLDRHLALLEGRP
jgi:Fic family protein